MGSYKLEGDLIQQEILNVISTNQSLWLILSRPVIATVIR